MAQESSVRLQIKEAARALREKRAARLGLQEKDATIPRERPESSLKQTPPQGMELAQLARAVGIHCASCKIIGDSIERLGIIPLTRQAFTNFVFKMASEAGSSSKPSATAVCKLFETFDTNSNGTLERSEVAGGMATLACGTAEEKAELAFRMYDNNGDGKLNLEELTVYLSSVFKVLFRFDAEGRHSHGLTKVSPEEVARDTAVQAFKSLDVDGDAQLSLEEFKHFFHGPDQQFGSHGEDTSRKIDSDDEDYVPEDVDEEEGDSAYDSKEDDWNGDEDYVPKDVDEEEGDSAYDSKEDDWNGVKAPKHRERLRSFFPDMSTADIDAALQASNGILVRAVAHLRKK